MNTVMMQKVMMTRTKMARTMMRTRMNHQAILHLLLPGYDLHSTRDTDYYDENTSLIYCGHTAGAIIYNL